MSLVKKRRQAEVNTQPAQPVSSQPKSKLYSTITTSYQENLFQPSQSKNWYSGDAPTGREIMGRIGEISKSRPNEAADLYGVYKQLQNDATSRYFNPYTQATNRAVDNLKAMGIDTSNINDDWYQKNSWLKNHYIFSGTTNTPSKPGAKATAEQKAAYEYYQLAKQEEATKKVEQQWDALKEELTYWANRKDRNYSDDEIIGKVDWSKYKSLTDLEEAARLGAPTELNRATDFSRDNMYAVLWAARNNGGSGNMESDLMYSAMGVGNQWKKNQNIADRLDPQSANYSPYSVGSTLEQEGLYFNRESFDQKWLDENRDILSGNDETAIKMYQSVYAAEQKTQKAEAEKAKFDAAFERRLRNAKNPEDAVKWLDRMLGSSDYSTLKAMNDSLGNAKLMDTTRAIDFSRADYVRKINEACERNNRAPDDDAVVKDISSSVGVHDEPEQNAAPDSTGKIGNIASAGGRLPAATPEQINRANNEQLQEGYDIIRDDMDAAGVTPAEEAVMRNAGSFNFRATADYLKAVKGTKLDPWDRFSKKLIQKSAGATSTAVLENADTIAEYEQAQKGIDTLYQQSDALKAQIDENVLAGMGLSADDLDFYGKDMPESITETIDVDGTPAEVRLVYDSNLTHKFYLLNDYEVDENNPAVQAAINDANRKRDAAVAAQNLTEEQQAAVDQYKALQDRIDQTNDFLRDGKADYDEAVSRTEDAAKLREATIRLLTKVGADVSELEDTTAVTGFFLDFTKYEPTQWMAYDTYADYAKRMTGKSGTAEFSDQVFAEAQAEDEKVMQALEVAQWSMDYANRKGIVLPDGVRNNFERYVAKLQRTHQDFEHLSYLAEPDFNEGVADGREIYARSRDWQENNTPENQPLWDMLTEEQQEDVENLWLNGSQADAASAYENYVSDIHMRGTFGLYQIDNLLTDIERDTWYYLLGTKGAKAAQDYFNYLADPDYGVLNTRSREYTEMAAQEMTDSGLLGFAAANTLSVLLSPVASVGSAIYALDYAGRRANGENPELNPDSPWLTANIFRNATRAESAKQIKETFKDAPVLQTLAQGGYEILTNRADSMMNAVTFGSIFPWANGVSNEMLQEFLGASPMGMTAAMDAAAEAKQNGATDDQALGVAGVTFFAETVTEAISLDNIKNAFAGGKEISAKTMEDFLKNWLTRSGISEMAGESVNDIVEGFADYFIMGDNSEFAQIVQSYIDDGMSPDDARAAAIRDEIGSLLHTALISYLSPGMNIVSFGAGRFHAYRNQTRVLQQNGYNVSVLDVMRMEREGRQERRNRPQPREQATQSAQTAQAAPANEGSAQTPAPGRQTARDFDEAQRLAAEAEAAQRASDEEAVRDWEILETAKGADASVQSSSLAAVLDTGNTQESSDAASAAAVGLWQIFSQGQGNFLLNAMRSSLGDYDLTTPVQNIQRFIVGANEAGVNPTVVKEALQNAVLGGSESAAYQAVTSMQHASPADQARTLAATLEADNANPAVQQNKERAIHEWRVAEAEKQLIANGALDSARDGRDAADAAAQRTNAAQQELAERDAAVEAAGQAIAVAGDEIQKASGDPQRMAEAANQMTHAIAQKEHTVAVQGEYQQKLAKAVADQQAAEQKAKRIKDSAMKLIREQAEQAVAQEDQQRAEAAAVAAEQQRVLAEQQAQAAAVEAERSGVAQELSDNEKIREYVSGRNLTDDEKQQLYDALSKRQDQKRLNKIDMSGKLSNAEGYLALRAFERKTGLQIQFANDLGAARGKYANGIVYLNSNLAEGNQLTIGQALVECSLHEITHSLESTKNYDKYADTVLDILYGGTDTADYKAAISKKIADYEKSGVKLEDPDARKELVADFARTHLNEKDVVQRFLDNGLGGRMRNILHNINQAIRNFKLTGDEKKTAENLRRAERLFQKALEEKARTDVHPAGDQFSIPQFAQSVGLYFDENTGKMYDRKGGREFTKDDINIGMIEQTPVGRLIDAGITGEQNQKAKQMMTDLMKLCVEYNDSNLVWEIAATTLSSTFSAVKSNSDKQYNTTIDFGTICAKTQEIVNVMSDVMLQRVKEGKTGGLTRKEVMKVYDATHNANLTVPCPVCYVFSRWMGVPSLLGQISEFQNTYVAKNADGTINWEETSKLANDYIKNAQAKYGDKDAITDAKTKLQNRIAKLEEKRSQAAAEYAKAKDDEKAEAKKQLEDIVSQQDAAEADLKEVEAYNWVTQALCKQRRQGKKTIDVLDADGNHVVDKSFELTPDEILFDLRRTAEFANYAKNWRYRNTRGAGMGKAIMPYSGMAIGDVIYGDKPRRLTGNPFLEGKSIKRALNDARKRAAKQNLIGGQRLQSTSDFRPEWGLDYIMSFLELQAMKSKAQMYTKVPEALDFLASVGADVNMSIMAQGNGYHLATEAELAKMSQRDIDTRVVEYNGQKYIMDFSPVTGMRYETAMDYNDKYNNLQPILVGMNDTHIRLAMLNDHISFIIPWHSSGNSKDVLQTLVGSVGERLEESSDYTDTQSDAEMENRTQEQTDAWNARMKILQGKANDMTEAEWRAVHSIPMLESLYNRFYKEGVDADCYGVKLSKDQASQIFPYEYWDTSSTRENADINGQRFVEYCQTLGMTPRFSGVVKHQDDGTFTVTGNFAGAVYDENGNITGYDATKMDPGYWKVLIDRPMYDNNVMNDDGTVKEYGKYRAQQTIDVTNARVGELDENHHLVNSDLPKNTEAKYVSYDPRNPNYGLYEERHQQAVMDAQAQINAAYDLTGQNSIDGDITDADLDQMLRDAGVDYMDAVSRGDMEAAQEDVDYYAEQKGYTIKAYHGTPNGKFNVFDKSKVGTSTDFGKIGRGFYFTTDKQAADYYARDTENSTVMPVYLKLTNPFVLDEKYDNMTVREMYDSILGEGGMVDEQRSEELTQWLIDHGYDGIVSDNEYMVLNPESIKSADPVTYDDNGNVIPLDERFTDSPDIRYSINGEMTDADIDQMLNVAGIASDEYAMPLEGTNPMATTAGGEAQRQFGSQHGMLSESDELDRQAIAYVMNQDGYTPDTNAAQLDRAMKWIRSNRSTPNSDGLYESLQKITANNFDYRSADGQARMIAVMGMAAAKNDILAQTALADAFNRQGTDLGRALQSRKLFRLMTPEGRISTLQKMLQDQQDELDSKGMNVDLKFSEWVLRAASVAEDEADFRKVQQVAAIEIAQQVPASWRDKLRGWRMLSMLGNPRTHLRNIIGNALFAPVVGIKNKLGAVGEIATRQEQRTKTLAPFLKKEVRNFARKDAQAIKDMLTGDAKYNEGTQVKREMKPFKGLLQAIIDLNGNALEGEDWFFLKGHYRRAFGGWMQANGYTEAQLENDAELLEKGRAYAIQEAQKATYRDFNGLAQRLNQLTRNPKTTGQKVLAFGVEAALPFKKTPANILKRGLEYSPVGLIRSLTSDIYHLHQWNQYQDGKLRAMPEGAISPNQFIDRICSGLSGTMIMAVGAFLGHAGIITCGLDDDDDKLEKEQGNQEYSIKIAGHTFTVDWAAPMSMPFFVGAAIQEQLANQEGFDIEELANAFGNIAEPVFNLSMLDGINSLFKTSQFDDTDAITQIGAKIASNYATSYVPSLLGAIARTIDDTRRKAYVESGKGTGVLGTFRYAYEQTQNKIPGWSQTNIPYRNVWGEAETSSLAERILENFILPGYITEYGKDPVLNEMARLYDSTGDSSMIPSDPAKTVTYKKQKYVLTAEQWDTYKAERGQAALNVLTELINSPDYLAANDSTQLQMVKEAWSYADQVGKSAIIPDYEMNAIADAATIAKNGKITSYKDDMMTALTTGDYEGYETMVEALREEGVEDSVIKDKISDYYRDRYKDAYRKDDYAKMAEIEGILDNTDFTFNIHGKNGWEDKVDQEND